LSVGKHTNKVISIIHGIASFVEERIMVSKEVGEEYHVSRVKDSNIRSVLRFKVPDKYAEIKAKLLKNLNPLEVDIYILLLENNAKKIVELAALIGFDRTETYHLVSALQNKGLVTATFTHPIKFAAVPIDKAFKILSKTKIKTTKNK